MLHSSFIVVDCYMPSSDKHIENAYYQYFCGMQEFIPNAPFASSELVHFRNRFGEKGVELIFQERIRVNNEDNDGHHHETAFSDSSVQ